MARWIFHRNLREKKILKSFPFMCLLTALFGGADAAEFLPDGPELLPPKPLDLTEKPLDGEENLR